MLSKNSITDRTELQEIYLGFEPAPLGLRLLLYSLHHWVWPCVDVLSFLNYRHFFLARDIINENPVHRNAFR